LKLVVELPIPHTAAAQDGHSCIPEESSVMSATILQFPARPEVFSKGRRHPRLRRGFAIVVTGDGLGGWYVIRESRSHGWLHGDIQQAFEDAQEMARADAVAVEVRS
jgi:hypothetical protein